LNNKDGIGSLIVGGNVEVFNGDLRITENLKGVRFGAGVVADGSGFSISSPIDFILTSHDDDWGVGKNVWEIRKNSQGQLEPFLVGEKEPSVVITRLDIVSAIKDKDVNSEILPWIHDVFSSTEQDISGRILDVASVRLTVTEEDKKILDKTKGSVTYDSLKSYTLGVVFSEKLDRSGKSQSSEVTKGAGIKFAGKIGEGRLEIQKVIRILDVGTATDSFAVEKKLLLAFSNGPKDVGLSEKLLASIMEMPSVDLVQAGVDLTGYRSYEGLRNTNFEKIRNALQFIDNGLEGVQKGYASGGLKNDMAISIIKKANGDLFLRDGSGKIFSIDTEIEPFIAQVLPLLAYSGIEKVTGVKVSEKATISIEKE